MENIQLLINKNDLSDHRFETTAAPDADNLGDNEVLLNVDEFAFTANNITYAVAGDSMGYWQFFPAAEGWGRIPVWGYATVQASHHPDIEAGERLYGYLPMGTHLTITPGHVSEHQVVDAVEHRSGLPAVYNQYLRVSEPHDAKREALQMLYRPLFMTSWLLDDFLDHNQMFGAAQVILTSASSKTSIGLAYLLNARPGCKVIGLTSSGNREFVEGLGCYSQVVDYDSIDSLDASEATVTVDMAGNGTTLAALHNHFADNLKHSCLVGATHWDARAGAQQMAGPKPELFFAPNHIKARNEEWGPGGLEGRFDSAWQGFTQAVGDWISIERINGPAAVAATYDNLLSGQAQPDVGYIVSVGT